MNVIYQDKQRYGKSQRMPLFQYFFRKCQCVQNRFLKFTYKVLYRILASWNHIEISSATQIGAGLYMNHPYCITINVASILGKNCNFHKGVTIGQENRGERKGTPTIGNNVWIGINATVVGKIVIGDDVLIAPNTYVNCDIPSHSVVFGNPCIIKHKEQATEGYINRMCEFE